MSTYPDGYATRISIHALREEGDHFFKQPDFTTERFQSTPSARRATGTGLQAE